MVRRSTVYALSLALGYGTLATAYILISSSMAADHSASVEELRRIETLKGVLYVAVTTLGVFAGGLWATRRMERDAQELLRREQALQASQGRVLAGVMAASIAHDANNLLTAVLGDLDFLRMHATADTMAPLAQLQASIDRLVALNRRLAQANRADPPREARDVDLARVVRDGVALVRAHRSLAHCRIVCRGENHLPTTTQPLLIQQILTNLLLNAGEACDGEGLVEVAVLRQDRRIVLEVHDNGPGIPADRRDQIFSALTSTKPDGAGLGLFSARACAQSLGGTITLDDSPLGGACFRVALPLQVHEGAPTTVS